MLQKPPRNGPCESRPFTFLTTNCETFSSGRDAAYSVPNRRHVRRYTSGNRILYATVAGALPKTDVDALKPARPGGERTLRFEIIVSQPGRVGLRIRNPKGLRLRFADGSVLQAQETTVVQRGRGRQAGSPAAIHD